MNNNNSNSATVENKVNLVQYNDGEMQTYKFFYDMEHSKFVEVKSMRFEPKDAHTLEEHIKLAKIVKCKCQRKPRTIDVYTDNIIVTSTHGDTYTADKMDLYTTLHILDRLNNLSKIVKNISKIIDLDIRNKEKVNEIVYEIHKYRSQSF